MPSFTANTRAEVDAQGAAMSRAITKYCDGRGIEICIQRPSKKRDQEKAFNAKITDIARFGVIEYEGRKVNFAEQPGSAFDVAKAFIIVWFESELRAQGKVLTKPSTWAIEPVSMMPLMLRASSSLFTAKEMGWAIEFVNVIGAENKIPWSDDKTKIYAEYPEMTNKVV
jgi:hypothetical protein